MSTPEWSVEERDKIAQLTRHTMLENAVEMEAENLRDYNWATDVAANGYPGYNSWSTWELREEQYRLNDIPEEHRVYQPGETPPPDDHYRTVGDLIAALLDTTKVKDRQWRLMIEFDLDGDVKIAGRITRIHLDGFHELVTLGGPKEGNPRQAQPPAITSQPKWCLSKDVVPWMVDRYKVRQCRKETGHNSRHHYKVRSDQPTEGFATPAEAKEWLRRN